MGCSSHGNIAAVGVWLRLQLRKRETHAPVCSNLLQVEMRKWLTVVFGVGLLSLDGDSGEGDYGLAADGFAEDAGGSGRR